MRNTLNQMEFVKYELNEKISSLLSSQTMETKIISDINDISSQNRPIAKELCDVIVSRAINERTSLNKLKILYIIDSIVKVFRGEFIKYLSPHIFRIFEETYLLADEETKISLFKLYYAWKYILPQNILESLCSRFGFDKMKNYLLRERPELIEKYDKYNEAVWKENMMKEMMVNVPTPNSSINLVQTSNNIAVEMRDPRMIDRTDNTVRKSSLFEKKGTKESFLNEIKASPKRTKITHDDLFSSGSDHSSKRISGYSDNEIKKKKQVREKISEFGDLFSNHLSDIPITKKKDLNTKPPSNTVTEKSKTLNVITKQNTINKNISEKPLNTGLNIFHGKSITPTENSENVKGTNPNSNIQQMLVNSLMSIPQMRKLLMNFNKPQLNVEKPTSTPNQSSNISENNHEFKQNHPAKSLSKYDTIGNFIKSSPISLNTSTQLFSSISKFFHEAIQESDPIREIIKDSKDSLIKKQVDILKIKDFTTKDSYKELFQKVLDSLSTDLKNLCNICGFRTKFYIKFLEHLDIHFHINYIKRNSQRKVLYRKESMNKNSWIQSGQLGSHNTVEGHFTLNSVLFYQNDTDHLVNNNKADKDIYNFEENEQLIIPVQPDSEMNCVYCGEDFKKRYFNKYHYWFYVNVFKLNRDEITNYEDIFSLSNIKDYALVHESCIEEFLNMVKKKESINFLSEKRNR